MDYYSPEIEKGARIDEFKRYLCAYLEIESLEKCTFLEAPHLSGFYAKQYDYFEDERLSQVMVCVVPDEIWHKGMQPSESHVPQGLILLKESYYRQEENPDEIAWLTHELAHCQKLFDSENEQEYQRDSATQAFTEIESDSTYPNNLVEKFTFTKQFSFLKESGVARQRIEELLKEFYPADRQEDWAFLQAVLDAVYN